MNGVRRKTVAVLVAMAMLLTVVSGTALAAAPGNDNFADAFIITGATGSTSGSNVEASLETDEPDHYGGMLGHSIWWSWTATADATMSFNTLGSTRVDTTDEMDTILAAYSGSNLTSLTKLAVNDDWYDSTETRNSQVTFKVVAGTTYHLVAGGYSTWTGTIMLNWSAVTPPTNDDFPGTAISGVSGQATGNNIYATMEADEPAHRYPTDYVAGASSIWWAWTAPTTGTFAFDTLGSYATDAYEPYELDTIMAVYTGSSVGELTLIASNDNSTYGGFTSRVDLAATEGVTYHIAVDGADSGNYSIADVVLNWNPTEAPAITSADSTVFTVGTHGYFDVTATGVPAPEVTITSGSLPPGVIFDASTDTIHGDPYPGFGGVWPLVITAANGIGSNATQNFTLTVNEAPSFVPVSYSASFEVGVSWSVTLNATGYPAPGINLTAGTLPSGLSYDSATRTLSGTAASGTRGRYDLTFTASNGVTPNATQNFVLTVIENIAPTISAQPEAQVVIAGDVATFTVEYNAYPSPTMQWQVSTSGGKRWSNIAGATSATYITSATTVRMDGYLYRVTLANNYGNVVSDAALLTVMPGTYSTANVSIDTEALSYDPTTKVITWVIAVSNGGPETATGVSVTDILAKGTRLVSIDLTGIASATYKVRGGTIDVFIGDLAKDAWATFTLCTEVTRALSPVTNSVTVTTTSYDPISTDNTAIFAFAFE